MALTHLTSETFDQAVNAGDDLVVVDFFATWCGPCKMLAPTVEKMAELHPEVHFYKVDIDEDMDLATRFKVMSVPTLLYFRSSSVFFCIKPLSLFFSQSKKTPEYDILMIPKTKGYKSDASILAGGILNLRPSKNMSRKPENQQEKQQMSSRSFSCTCFCVQFSASRTRISEADATPTPLKFGHN